MYALFLFLNDVHLLDDVHEVFYECGVGATSWDSMGMGKVLMEHHVNATMFASIRKLLEGHQPYNKTIVSVIRTEEKLDEVIHELKERIHGITDVGVGFMFVIPVMKCYGFNMDLGVVED